MVTTIGIVTLAFAVSGSGPIAASIARHASDPIESRDAPQWSRLDRIPRGTDLIVETHSGAIDRGQFVSVDESEMTMLDVHGCALTRAGAGSLSKVARDLPELLSRERVAAGFSIDNVRVGPDGVFVSGTRMCDVSDVIKRLTQSGVVIVKGVRTRGSVAATAAVVAGGVIVGLYAAASAECRADQTGCQAGLATLTFGLPIALGAGVYHATKHTVETVYYRANHSADAKTVEM